MLLLQVSPVPHTPQFEIPPQPSGVVPHCSPPVTPWFRQYVSGWQAYGITVTGTTVDEVVPHPLVPTVTVYGAPGGDGVAVAVASRVSSLLLVAATTPAGRVVAMTS